MSAKMATLGHKSRNKGYDIIIPLYGLINKALSRDLNYTVNVVM